MENDKIETYEVLLKKIEKLEESHAQLKEEMSKLMMMNYGDRETRWKYSSTLTKETNSGGSGDLNMTTEGECVNILESMDQAVHMLDLNGRIIYWNQMAENLYGYTAAEAIGKTAPETIIGPQYLDFANLIIQQALKGESWSGEYPVRNKNNDKFNVISNVSPSRDENGRVNGFICVATGVRLFNKSILPSRVSSPVTFSFAKYEIDIQQPLHNAFTSKISNMDSMFKSKLKTIENNMDQYSDFAPFDHRQDIAAYSTGESSNSNLVNKFDTDIDNLDFEISWDDLIIGEQIGQGLCGTIYHALWYGSDVTVNVFSKHKYPDDAILSFKKDVSLMKRLRHPNILLFMGAVNSPQHLCIVTEFLSRGNLYRLLQRNTITLDWRRRFHMAMDIARGMNYLHHCQPPIVHCNLKSSNLFVDKNWTVKVSGDFGFSRIKHETYSTTKTAKGTPRWMAPEILRHEQAQEKSDVYSYGVVLWEITTGKIPWENLNSLQVIGVVGFLNQRLEIPKDVDPEWASLIESCWSSEPQSRPTFQEILTKLKDLQKKFVVPHRDNSHITGSL